MTSKEVFVYLYSTLQLLLSRKTVLESPYILLRIEESAHISFDFI
jgi:hypothetical protein